MSVWVLTDNRYLGQRMPSAVVDWLQTRDLEARLVVVEDHVVSVDGSRADPWDGVAPGDVVLGRTRDPFGLALLGEASRPGVHVVIPRDHVEAVRDKSRLAGALARAGLPAPPTFLAPRPEHLTRLPAHRFPLLVKPVRGDNARGIVLVADPDGVADLDWDGEIVVAQTWVDTDGWDLKVYGVDDQVWCVRRPSPIGPLAGDPTSVPVAPTAEITELAHRCRQVFDLPLYGIDVLEGPEGPVVVDVNEFPNYTGVPDAPECIGALLLRLAEGASPGEAVA